VLWLIRRQWPQRPVGTRPRNLIYYQEGQVIGSNGIENSKTNVCTFDRNLYWNLAGAPVLFGSKSFSEWQAQGQDQHSLVADPCFEDATQGDFRLQPGSPVEKIGLKPWDMKTVGPRPSSVRPR
jgi:hypothetical protein